MPRSKSRAMTQAQANILIAELGVVALSSLMVIGGTVTSWFKLKRKAVEVIEQVT
jgi:ABC-type uncharacterized transport system permease subunit